MRNFSSKGAKFDGVSDLVPGQNITYCVGDSDPIEANVVWTDGHNFGVENFSDLNSAHVERLRHSYRSVRLPVMAPAILHHGNSKTHCLVRNLSQRGACIETETILERGELLSLTVGNNDLENAEVRWTEKKLAGLKFAAPLARPAISKILDNLALENTPLSG